MSDSLNKYCSEAKDFKDVKDAMNKIQKLRAQMKNPTRDGMIEALRDAKISALTEISALEMAQGATSWAPFSAASDSTLYRLLGQYEQGLRLHCIAKIGEKAFAYMDIIAVVTVEGGLDENIIVAAPEDFL